MIAIAATSALMASPKPGPISAICSRCWSRRRATESSYKTHAGGIGTAFGRAPPACRNPSTLPARPQLAPKLGPFFFPRGKRKGGMLVVPGLPDDRNSDLASRSVNAGTDAGKKEKNVPPLLVVYFRFVSEPNRSKNVRPDCRVRCGFGEENP
jgi:hypothetical protein